MRLSFARWLKLVAAMHVWSVIISIPWYRWRPYISSSSLLFTVNLLSSHKVPSFIIKMSWWPIYHAVSNSLIMHESFNPRKPLTYYILSKQCHLWTLVVLFLFACTYILLLRVNHMRVLSLDRYTEDNNTYRFVMFIPCMMWAYHHADVIDTYFASTMFIRAFMHVVAYARKQADNTNTPSRCQHYTVLMSHTSWKYLSCNSINVHLTI
jgi:hypothetical protein